MLPFDDAVCSMLIRREPNVVDVVLSCQVFQAGDHSWAVVCDNLFDGAPSAQNFLKDERAYRSPIFRTCRLVGRLHGRYESSMYK